MPHSHAIACPANDAAPLDLQAVRARIDRIDQAILDLMEERLSTSLAVAALKSDADRSHLLLRPDREQEVIDRLGRRSKRMPKAAISVVWRELMALNLQSQRRTEIALHAAEQPVLVTDEARRRFGCAAPILVSGTPDEALDRARSHEAVAVIELSPLSSWWVALFHDESIAIFDCLRENGRISALVVGRVAPASLPSGLTFPIVSEATLARRLEADENIRPLAICGHLRLCIAEGPAAVPARKGKR